MPLPYSYHRANSSRDNNRGIALLSTIVSVAIVLLFTTTLAVREASFESSVELTDAAYKTALQIREAQQLSTGVRSIGTRFDYPHGILFDMDSPSEFTLFADKNENGEYDSGDGELVRALSFQPGFTITRVCATDAAGSQDCSDSGSVNSLVVRFKRPETTPDFFTYSTTGADIASDYVAAEIRVSRDGKHRLVVVSEPGQVSVTTP